MPNKYLYYYNISSLKNITLYPGLKRKYELPVVYTTTEYLAGLATG